MPEETLNAVQTIDFNAVDSITFDQLVDPSFAIAYIGLFKTVSQLADIKSKVDAKMKALIEEKYYQDGTCKIQLGDLTLTYVAGSFREDFDKKAFKEAHPEEYAKWLKTTPTSSQLRIKVKEAK